MMGMKRRDFIRTAAAIAAAIPAINAKADSDKPKSLVLPDSDGIKMENTWARWETREYTWNPAKKCYEIILF
jgi:hypothetical protein